LLLLDEMNPSIGSASGVIANERKDPRQRSCLVVGGDGGLWSSKKPFPERNRSQIKIEVR